MDITKNKNNQQLLPGLTRGFDPKNKHDLEEALTMPISAQIDNHVSHKSEANKDSRRKRFLEKNKQLYDRTSRKAKELKEFMKKSKEKTDKPLMDPKERQVDDLAQKAPTFKDSYKNVTLEKNESVDYTSYEPKRLMELKNSKKPITNAPVTEWAREQSNNIPSYKTRSLKELTKIPKAQKPVTEAPLTEWEKKQLAVKNDFYGFFDFIDKYIASGDEKGKAYAKNATEYLKNKNLLYTKLALNLGHKPHLIYGIPFSVYSGLSRRIDFNGIHGKYKVRKEDAETNLSREKAQVLKLGQDALNNWHKENFGIAEVDAAQLRSPRDRLIANIDKGNKQLEKGVDKIRGRFPCLKDKKVTSSPSIDEQYSDHFGLRETYRRQDLRPVRNDITSFSGTKSGTIYQEERCNQKSFEEAYREEKYNQKNSGLMEI